MQLTHPATPSTASTPSAPAPIALIGIGCRFPGGATDVSSLWRLLMDGRDAIGPIPADRWDPDRFYSPRPQTPGRTISLRAGCLQTVDEFDAAFFGIAPRVAEQMDPQQRHLLEVTWEALEDAGIPPLTLEGSRSGVFIGACSHDYGDIQSSVAELEGLNAHSATGNFLSIVANRLSYTLNLRGPSIALDTACSSSLVAVHLACAALRAGECELALAGGVNLILSPHFPISLSQANMLSPDGVSRAFDASANGYARGEGAGVVVLKPLADALRDRDRIYAVIGGSAVNQDGRTPGITMPSEASQEVNFKAALDQARVSGAEIGYVEAHGTGTPVGDPIEANAIGRALHASGRPRDRRFFVGSIKTNIGHLEAGAGIASLIKAALVVQRRQIPPSLHFKEPNPAVDWDRWHMAVPVQPEPWPDGYDRAIASVNSFGFGGTNANVVLLEPPRSPPRQAPAHPTPGPDGSPSEILTLSARSEAALATLAAAYQQRLEELKDASLPDVAHFLACRRSHHRHRLAVIANDLEGAAAALGELVQKGEAVGVTTARRGAHERRRVAFIFNGQGPQWWGMGHQLFAREPVFRAVVEECDRLARRYVDWSVREELLATEQTSRVGETSVLQPTMFALQMGLLALWQSWGVQPEAVMGHSLGDISAACAAGIIDLDTALRIICHRARIQAKADPGGGMLYASISPAAARAWCDRSPGQLWLSAVNSPKAVTFSGDRKLLAALQSGLQAEGAFARVLRVNCACHSPHMDPLRDELMEYVRSTHTQPGQLPFYSTVSGEPAAGEALTPDYWWTNFRQPVRFHDALTRMIDDGFNTFVELSPHPVLLQAIRDVLEERQPNGLVVSSLRRGEDDRRNLQATLARLYVEGVDVRWQRRYEEPAPVLDLPLNPWQRERFWFESAVGVAARKAPQAHAMLRRTDAPLPIWETRWDDHRLTWVKDHRIFGGVILPAAGYLEMALSAVAELTGRRGSLENVVFERACILEEGEPMLTRIVLDPEAFTFEIHSRPARGDTWTRHVKGRFFAAEGGAEARLDLAAIRARCPDEHDAFGIYDLMASKGYAFGPTFCGIAQHRIGDSEGLARIEVPRLLRGKTAGYTIHPALMDACFQSGVLLPPRACGVHDLLHFTYLPTGVGQVRLHHPVQFPLYSHVQARRIDAAGFCLDVRLVDGGGRVVAEFLDFAGNRVDDSERRGDPLEDHLYRFEWKAAPLAEGAHGRVAPWAAPADLPSHSDLQPVVERLRGELGRAEYHREYLPKVGQLCAGSLARCLVALGLDLTVGRRLTAEDLAAVLPKYRRWLESSLEILVHQGVLVRRGRELEVAAVEGLDAGTWERRWAELRRDFPSCHAELMVLRRTAAHLAEVVTGQRDPLELLFEGGSHDVVEPLYDSAPISRLYNLVVRELVDRLMAGAAAHRAVRILEVGAGTGGLTGHLLPLLDRHRDRVRYHYTDVSVTFLEAAKEKFAPYDFVSYASFDLEQDPERQGYSLHDFDVILASNVLHATRDLGAVLKRLAGLLAPGGALAVIEALPRNPWLHVTFGLTDGWWAFTDRQLRQDGPLLGTPAWLRLLEECGYRRATAWSDAVEEAVCVQQVLFALAPDVPAAPAALAIPPDPGRWLIFADRAGLGDRLARAIRSSGGTCLTVTPGLTAEPTDDSVSVQPNDKEELRRLVRRAPWEGIVHLWNLDLAPLDLAPPDLASPDLASPDLASPDLASPDLASPDLADRRTDDAALSDAVTLGSLSLAHIAAAVESVPGGSPTRLFAVTRGGQAIRNHGLNLLQAPAWGVGLVAGLELPDLPFTTIDLAAECPPEQALLALSRELFCATADREVVLRGPDRMVRRLRRVPASERLGWASSRTVLEEQRRFQLQSASKGTLDRLVYQECDRPAPGPGEVEVLVAAASLNYLDVMTALGQVPRFDESEHGFGGECAGVVTRVGPGVIAFEPGSPVIVVRKEQGTIASHVTVDARHVFDKPARLSWDESCQLPIAFLTAWYALSRLGRLQPGERVLIHSATGGTGLACVQVAQLLGAEVFATAGTEAKREYLRGIGVEQVMSSRSLDFADEVRDRTRGRGVDVVVNSIARQSAARGIASLAPFGRFVEIGKRDLLADASLGLKPFLNNLSYFSFDLRQLLAARPAEVAEELQALLRRFADGTLRPLPHRTYPASQVQRAFRQMANAGHIGKLVISMEGPVRVVRKPRTHHSVDGTWLVAGGLGGIGLRVAERLARSGARRVLLLGRTLHPEALQAAERIAGETGSRVEPLSIDIADGAALGQLIAGLREARPPLRGVVSCAMVLDDALLPSLTETSMRAVMAPKILGSWNLHRLTAGLELDAFILFSSMTSMLGNQGQCNYAVANTFLDALAQHRAAEGLPATCVSWGVVADAGYVAARDGLRAQLEVTGAMGIKTDEALDLLMEQVTGRLPHVGAFRVDWSRYARVALRGRSERYPRYEEVVPRGSKARGSDGAYAALADLDAQSEAERAGFLRQEILRRIAHVLGLPVEKLDVEQPLTDYLDSLLVVEVVTWLEKAFGVKYTLTEIIKGPSVHQLAEDLGARLQRLRDARGAEVGHA